MLKSRLGIQRGFQVGFALPTVLIASIIMLIVMLSAVSATSGVRVALDDQYYTKLAQEAAEAGQAYAEDCLEDSNYAATWTDTTRLRPDTDCNGAAISGGNRYIVQNGNIRTTFVVWAPVIGSSSSTTVTVVGTTELLRTSTQSVYQSYPHTLVKQSRYVAQPKIAGGGGWQGSKHLAAVLSTNQKLYGFGANDTAQINDTSIPTSVLTPMNMTLPTGVTSVVDVVTAGQGAGIICIMGNNAQVYCRGAPGGTEDGLMPVSPAPNWQGWQRFGLPAGLTAVSMSISGYGPDSMCVLASDGQGYCAGENSYGSLGLNDTTYRIIKIGSPERFRLDIPAPGKTLRKIHTDGNVTCGITVTDPATQRNDMYCAGYNTGGAIGGPVIAGTGMNRYAYPIRYPIPGARSIDDVAITYHVSDDKPVVHVLATDGTIWSSGDYKFGDLGNGSNSGSTGTSQAPSLFTHTSNKAWATGSELWNAQSNKCIDNDWDADPASNGNKIQLWDCSTLPNSMPQGWVYGTNKQLTNLGTGKCLDVPGGNFTAGVKLQLYDCNNSPAQQFELVGTETIKPTANSNLCLDATSNGTANGTLIELWDCYGNGAQSFTRWPTITGWRGMIVGMNHFCGVREDQWSGMWCAGRNNYGQLVNDASTYPTNPGGTFATACTATPEMGHSIANVNLPNPDNIAGGEEVDYTKLNSEWNRQYNSTMLITKAGNVYGAGRNQFGKLGDGSIGTGTDFAECGTTRFVLPTGVKAVALSARDEFTTYVLGNNGRIYAAGRNNLGQLGNGSSTTSATPTPVEVRIPRQAIIY